MIEIQYIPFGNDEMIITLLCMQLLIISLIHRYITLWHGDLNNITSQGLYLV